MRVPVVFVAALICASVAFATVEPATTPVENCHTRLLAEMKKLQVENKAFADEFVIDSSAYAASDGPKSPLIEAQELEVARFIAWIYSEFPVSRLIFFPVSKVEIVPLKGSVSRIPFDFAGTTLIIRLDNKLITADSLRSMWQRGDHIPSDLPWPLPRRSTGLSLWKYANPTGFTFQAMRKGLHITRGLLGDEIQRLIAKLREKPSELRNAIRPLIAGVADKSVEADLTSALDEVAEDEVVPAVERLQAWLANPATVTDVLSRMTMTGITADGTPASAKVTVEMWFSIYLIGNFHWIRVQAAYGSKSISMVASTLPAFKELYVRIVCSFIGIYTVDVIDVQAFADKAYIASAIEAAFRQSE